MPLGPQNHSDSRCVREVTTSEQLIEFDGVVAVLGSDDGEAVIAPQPNQVARKIRRLSPGHAENPAR